MIAICQITQSASCHTRIKVRRPSDPPWRSCSHAGSSSAGINHPCNRPAAVVPSARGRVTGIDAGFRADRVLTRVRGQAGAVCRGSAHRPLGAEGVSVLTGWDSPTRSAGRWHHGSLVKVGRLGTATGFDECAASSSRRCANFRWILSRVSALSRAALKPPVPVNVGRVTACRIKPQLLSKLGAQALVLLSASHNTPRLLAPWWGGRAQHWMVTAASSSEPPDERGVGAPSSRSLTTASREASSG